MSEVAPSEAAPEPPIEAMNIQITRGNRPAMIPAAVRMQTAYYTRMPGFNADYSTHLAHSLAELAPFLTGERSEVWTAELQDRIVGTIFVDGRDKFARLTSFIVDDGFRGAGIGRRLLAEAIAFIDGRGFEETRLWTFEGSDAARRLYEAVGFALEKEVVGEYFGKELNVQLFVRKAKV